MRYTLNFQVQIDTSRDSRRTAEWIAEQIVTYCRSWLGVTGVVVNGLVEEVPDAPSS